MNFEEFKKQLHQKQEDIVKVEAELGLKREALGKFLHDTLGVSPGGVARLEDVVTMIDRVTDLKGTW